MQAVSNTTEVNSAMSILLSIPGNGKQEASEERATKVKDKSLKLKKSTCKKTAKKDVVFNRLARVNMDICHVSAVMQKYVKFTDNKIEMLESKIQAMEKMFQKKDDRHKIGYIVA